MKAKIFLLIFISQVSLSHATHNRAGYISLRYVSNLMYEATITTFTKASSTQADRDTLVLNWGDGTVEKLLRINGAVGGNGVPQGEILPDNLDLKLNIYRSSIHTYSFPGDYIVSTIDPNRINNIININGGASVNIQFYTETYLRVGLGSCENSSPVLLSPPIMVANLNDAFIFNPTVIDPDGDSLYFELTAPLQEHDIPVPNYQYPDEIDPGINNVFSINHTSGEIFWLSPQRVGTYNASVRISEFKSGLFFGYTIFDYQIIADNVASAFPSFNTNWQVDTNGNYAITINPGDTLQLSFNATADSLSAAGEIFSLPQAALFSQTGIAPALTGSFFWITDSVHARRYPYITSFRASKNSVLPLERDLTLLIYVTGAELPSCIDSLLLSGLVWAGDANSDGIANMYDVLNIGIGYGSSGQPRFNAVTNWIGQIANDWIDTFHNGVNFKHADCNGNGVIDLNDVPSILLNYGRIHQKNSSPQRAVSPDLFLVFPQDSFQTGDTVTGEIHLGSQTTPVNNVYGIAFSLAYDPTIIDSNGVNVDFINSWLAPQTNRIGLAKNLYAAAKTDVGLSRTSHSNASGFGAIANVSFVIQDNIDGKDYFVLPLELQFEDVIVIDKDEAVVNVTANGDTLYIEGETVGMKSIEQKYNVRVFPNPATDEIIVTADADISEFAIMDVTGKEMIRNEVGNTPAFSVDISGLKTGSYFIRLKSADHYAVCRKVVILR